MTQDSAASRFFKGWAKPGPQILCTEGLPQVSSGESLDALSGDFKIFQLKDGHRFSTDDVLTAWYGTAHAPCARRILDLGSGIGSVGMLAAWRLPGAQLVTIEAQPESVSLAKKSVLYNGLQNRYEIREGDFRDPKLLGANEKFDLILGSPPYFPLQTGELSEHPQKQACRFEMRGDLSDYAKVAAKHLEYGGFFTFVFPIEPPHQYERVTAALREAGLTLVRWKPVILKEKDPPLLGLFMAIQSEHLPEGMRAISWQERALVIRDLEGNTTHEYKVTKLSFGFPPT